MPSLIRRCDHDVAASYRQLSLHIIHLVSCKDTADAAPSTPNYQEKMSFISKYEIIFPQKSGYQDNFN